MRSLVLLFLISFSLSVSGNDSTRQLYNPYADAEKDITMLLKQAKKENKHLLIQVGGNWCVWCYRFQDFVNKDSVIRDIIDKNYIVYHLNYSKENENLAQLKKLGYPQRFGFPVMVVMDGEGRRIHTQDSGFLEQGNGYDAKKVKSFFANWTPVVLNEESYK